MLVEGAARIDDVVVDSDGSIYWWRNAREAIVADHRTVRFSILSDHRESVNR